MIFIPCGRLPVGTLVTLIVGTDLHVLCATWGVTVFMSASSAGRNVPSILGYASHMRHMTPLSALGGAGGKAGSAVCGLSWSWGLGLASAFWVALGPHGRDKTELHLGVSNAALWRVICAGLGRHMTDLPRIFMVCFRTFMENGRASYDALLGAYCASYRLGFAGQVPPALALRGFGEWAGARVVEQPCFTCWGDHRKNDQISI